MNIDDAALAPFRAVGRGRGTQADVTAVLAGTAKENPLSPPAGGRVLLAGDWHGNTAHALDVLRYARRVAAETVIQLGDFGFSQQGEGHLDVLSATVEELGLTLLVIDGNHEDFPLLDRFPLVVEGPARGLRPVRPRVWHLPRGSRWTWRGLDGGVWRWLAVGGAASVDRVLRSEGYSWWAAEELTEHEAALIAGDGPADVVVCHDRPQAAAISLGDRPGEWWESVPPAWAREDLARSDAHAARLQRVVDAARPRHVWHGHLHRRTDVVLKPTAWGGECLVHGLAADETPLEVSTALVGLDGAVIEESIEEMRALGLTRPPRRRGFDHVVPPRAIDGPSSEELLRELRGDR